MAHDSTRDTGTDAPRQAQREDEKRRVPAEPIPQRPDETPVGNGGTNDPAAFPPHN